MNTNLIIALAAMLHDIFPDEVWDDGVEETARRVLDYWNSLVPQELSFTPTTFKPHAAQMVIVSGIEFSSCCAHHLLPFYGVAHIGYLPHQLAIGVSKIPRVVEHFAKRPQVQERLTHQIADYMQDTLKPKGTMVILEATHTCMSCRGILARNSKMITNELRGVFLTAEAARQEFMRSIERSSQ